MLLNISFSYIVYFSIINILSIFLAGENSNEKIYTTVSTEINFSLIRFKNREKEATYDQLQNLI